MPVPIGTGTPNSTLSAYFYVITTPDAVLAVLFMARFSTNNRQIIRLDQPRVTHTKQRTNRVRTRSPRLHQNSTIIQSPPLSRPFHHPTTISVDIWHLPRHIFFCAVVHFSALALLCIAHSHSSHICWLCVGSHKELKWKSASVFSWSVIFVRAQQKCLSFTTIRD